MNVRTGTVLPMRVIGATGAGKAMDDDGKSGKQSGDGLGRTPRCSGRRKVGLKEGLTVESEA